MRTDNVPPTIRHIVVAKAGEAQPLTGHLTPEGLFQVSQIRRTLAQALSNSRIAIVYSVAKCSQQTAETLSHTLNAQAFPSKLLKVEPPESRLPSPGTLAGEALRPIFQRIKADGFESVVIVCSNGMSDAMLDHLRQVLGVKEVLFDGKKLTPGTIVHFDLDRNAICRTSPSA